MKNPKKATKEKRKFQRFNLPVKVKYRLLARKRILEEIFTQNVSGGGISLRLSQPLEKDTRIKTLLYLPDDPHPVAAISEVVWCKKKAYNRREILNKRGKKFYYDTGIRHVKIIPKDRERFVFLFCEMMINFLTLGR